MGVDTPRQERGGWQKRKLTPAKRFEMQLRYGDGEDPKDLALEYGVSAGHIRNLGKAERPSELHGYRSMV